MEQPKSVRFNSSNIKSAGIILVLSGIALGAFGAHGLKTRVSKEDLEIFQTGVFYQLIHGLSLLIISLDQSSEKLSRKIALILFSATLIFSGTLYLLVLTGERWLGAITPIGGVGFMVGWGIYLCGSLRSKVSP